ncbi:MAG: hypothetical protein HYY16_02535 [Planctomycetes bacterium]|nr:hypothetical protein [Planctomycetota bacterium]
MWRRREEILKILLADEPLLIGSVYDTLRRCGNPTCRCAGRPTHRQTLLIFTKAGRRYCRFVRQADAPLLREAAERYRLWRQALREFLTLQNRERELLKVQIRKRAMPLK